MQANWRDLLFDVVRSKLLGPKDLFERFKRRSIFFLTAIITCAFLTPKFFGFVAGTFGRGQIENVLDLDVLVGISPDDVASTALLAAMLLSLAAFFLLSNLSYAKFNAKIQYKLSRKSKEAFRKESYDEFCNRIFEIDRNEVEKLAYLISHLKESFPDLSKEDVRIAELEFDLSGKIELSRTKLLPKPD